MFHDHEDIRDFHSKTKLKLQDDVPSSIDLSAYCSPIESQGQLNSCSANAAIGLLEYFENRAYGSYVNGSRLFLFKVGRNLEKQEGLGGIQLRTAMKGMATFGVPPEEYWPYDPDKVADEPSAFCYAFAQDYKSILYYKLGKDGDGAGRLKIIKTYLASGYPSMFGFRVFNMGEHPKQPKYNGEIWFPAKRQKPSGGHALVAVGYDDNKEIHDGTGKVVQKGALKVRNSWGTGWGDQGYGWMAYDYIREELATDFWSLIRAEYLDEGEFAP